MGQFLVPTLRLGLQLLFLGDIDAGTDIAKKLVVGIIAGNSAIGNPAVLSVVAAHPIVHREGPAGIKGLGINFESMGQIVGMNAFSPTISDLLLQSSSAEVEPRLIDEGAEFVGA